MKLSQLLKVMDKDDVIIVNKADHNLGLNDKRLYRGTVKGIYKDNPLNKGHIKYLLPFGNQILVEISLDERSENV